MNKYTIFIGVDVSKDKFDTYDFNIGHQQYNNDEKGYKSFCKRVVKESCVVMEATGSFSPCALNVVEDSVIDIIWDFIDCHHIICKLA